MKNFGFEATPRFGDGSEGDWYKFVAVPPPLLNVSTYLRKRHYKLVDQMLEQNEYNIEQIVQMRKRVVPGIYLERTPVRPRAEN